MSPTYLQLVIEHGGETSIGEGLHVPHAEGLLVEGILQVFELEGQSGLAL
jgi:hypothetical protein